MKKFNCNEIDRRCVVPISTAGKHHQAQLGQNFPQCWLLRVLDLRDIVEARINLRVGRQSGQKGVEVGLVGTEVAIIIHAETVQEAWLSVDRVVTLVHCHAQEQIVDIIVKSLKLDLFVKEIALEGAIGMGECPQEPARF
ncbi:hypothetical protein CR513_30813, partial [Mucuna pruriens]